MHICISKQAIIGSGPVASLVSGHYLNIWWLIAHFQLNFIWKPKYFHSIKMQSKISSVKWWPFCLSPYALTHWGRVTHICISKLTIIGSDNGLSPGQRQAIIWTSAGILLIGPLGTNLSKILIGIQTLSFKKIHLKMSSAKWRPFVSASIH